MSSSLSTRRQLENIFSFIVKIIFQKTCDPNSMSDDNIFSNERLVEKRFMLFVSFEVSKKKVNETNIDLKKTVVGDYFISWKY